MPSQRHMREGGDAMQMKWTPCKEKMPTVIDTYIICGKMKYSFESEYEYFVDAADFSPSTTRGEFSTWGDWYEGQDEYEILAWMPLPEPWKEGEE